MIVSKLVQTSRPTEEINLQEEDAWEVVQVGTTGRTTDPAIGRPYTEFWILFQKVGPDVNKPRPMSDI